MYNALYLNGNEEISPLTYHGLPLTTDALPMAIEN